MNLKYIKDLTRVVSSYEIYETEIYETDRIMRPRGPELLTSVEEERSTKIIV